MCCIVSGLCDGLITRTEESYRVCVCVRVIRCRSNALRLRWSGTSPTKRHIDLVIRERVNWRWTVHWMIQLATWSLIWVSLCQNRWQSKRVAILDTSQTSADFMSTPFITKRTHVSNRWTENCRSDGGVGRRTANDAASPKPSISGGGNALSTSVLQKLNQEHLI